MKKFEGRHEFKYYINYLDFIQLRSKLKIIADPDKNGIDGSGYRVKSLYFDNYNDKLLKENLEGVNNREKFRLRIYNDDASFIRIEKKRKVKELSFKKGAVISTAECKNLLKGNLDILKKNGNPLCLELYAKMQYQYLRPKNIVGYNREAFVYRMGNVRVTLDYNIRMTYNTYGFLTSKYLPMAIPNVYILEVKYDSFLPEVIRDIVSVYSRGRISFSKYAATRII